MEHWDTVAASPNSTQQVTLAQLHWQGRLCTGVTVALHDTVGVTVAEALGTGDPEGDTDVELNEPNNETELVAEAEALEERASEPVAVAESLTVNETVAVADGVLDADTLTVSDIEGGADLDAERLVVPVRDAEVVIVTVALPLLEGLALAERAVCRPASTQSASMHQGARAAVPMATLSTSHQQHETAGYAYPQIQISTALEQHTPKVGNVSLPLLA